MTTQVQIEGFFLEFDADEMRLIREKLASQGYEQDGKGLKKMMVDILSRHTRKNEKPEKKETEFDAFLLKAQDFIAKNPLTVALAMGAAQTAANNFLKKVSAKKPA
jgi:hypothetical protein